MFFFENGIIFSFLIKKKKNTVFKIVYITKNLRMITKNNIFCLKKNITANIEF